MPIESQGSLILLREIEKGRDPLKMAAERAAWMSTTITFLLSLNPTEKSHFIRRENKSYFTVLNQYINLV